MFGNTKNVVCIEFSKNYIFCALAVVTGKKVDIVSIDEMPLESGIIEDGIVYDQPHLEQIVKNLLTSVSKNHKNIDSAWIAIPDNKVRIVKFDLPQAGKEVDEYELSRAIEEKLNYPAAKLHLINNKTHELNGRAFYLTYAIRLEHLQPFIDILSPLGIKVESIFPTFCAIYQEHKKKFDVPTLLLHPYGNGFKFFVADQYGVYLESVFGHNVIELNQNFDKAVEEIIRYSRQSKEVTLDVKKILAIEASNTDTEQLQILLRKTGVDFSWIPLEADGEVDPVSLSILKGLIINAMSDNSHGFLGPQVSAINSEAVEYSKTPFLRESANETLPYSAYQTRNTVYKNSESLEPRINVKTIIATIVLAIALIGTLVFAGSRVAERLNSDKQASSTPTPTPTIPQAPTSINTPTPTITPTDQPSGTPSPTTVPNLTKTDIRVRVLNANSVPNEARRISTVLKNNGFVTKDPGNNPVRGIATTTITYKDQRAAKLAQEIVTLIEPNYPSSKAVFDANSSEDILIVLGAK